MGEKSIEFQTALSVKECGFRFKSGIENGRGASAWIGGVTAKCSKFPVLQLRHRRRGELLLPLGGRASISIFDCDADILEYI